MSRLFGMIRLGVLGLDLSQAEYATRGFVSGRRATRLRLDRIAQCVVHGYNLGLEAGDPERLAFLLDLIEPEMRGFAYEGGAMGLAAVDLWSPTGGRFERSLQGSARPHTYMSYIGAGGAAAVFSRSPAKLMARLDPFLAPLVLDGVGFFHAFMKTERTLRDKVLPAMVVGDSVAPYHAGIGRALWFAMAGDPQLLRDAILTFPDAVHGELWAGVGLAATYAGGVDAATLTRLQRCCTPYEPQLARGAVLAAHTRHVAGNMAPHVSLATQVLCAASDVAVHQMAVDAMVGLKHRGTVDGRSTWQLWLSRLDRQLDVRNQPTESLGTAS